MLSPDDRLAVLAPHPDDETLGTGGLLQEAVSAGIPFRVLQLTSGERNPWAQRVIERRLWLDRTARPRFASLRRVETLAALEALGVSNESVRFLEFPDQGLTDLLLGNPGRLVNLLRDELGQFRPSVVAGPSYWDLHPDHSALAVALDLAVAALPPEARPGAVWHYLVHHPVFRTRKSLAGTAIPLTAAEQDRKSRAILSHRSQHAWRGAWLRSFAATEEHFIDARVHMPGAPARLTNRENGTLRIALSTRPRFRAFGRRTLHLVTATPGGAVRSLTLPLPSWPALITARSQSPADGAAAVQGRYRGGPRCGIVEIPGNWAPPGHALYAKISRRFGFFDEAGWIPLARFDCHD